MRWQLISLQAIRDIKKLIHPSGIFLIKFKHQMVSNEVIQSVWGFFSVYIFVFLLATLVLLLQGLDFETSISSVLACLNNLGPGLGDVALHYGSIASISKGVLIFIMLLGRLEIFTLLVIFTTFFWKK